jgi:integrase
MRKEVNRMSTALRIKSLLEDFELAALLEGSTKHRCRVAVNTLIRCHGNIVARTLSPRKIAAWQLWCRDHGMSTSTVRSGFTAVAQVYLWAVREKLLVTNPFDRASKMKADRIEVRTFAAEELADLCKAAAELRRRDPSAQLRWYLLLTVAGTSGPRIGEILNLRWEDIDLDERILRIRYRPDKPGEYWRWGTKGKTDRRVPLSQDAVEGFYRLQLVAPWRYPILKRCTCERLQREVGRIPEDVRKAPYTNLYREWNQIRAKANEGRQVPIKKGAFHTLRKSAVSGWVAKGAQLPAAAYAAGHRSEQTTRTYYVAVDVERSIEQIRATMP